MYWLVRPVSYVFWAEMKSLSLPGFKYSSAMASSMKDGGYGDPLCKDPYGPEVSGPLLPLLQEAGQDRTVCVNNFQNPNPEVTEKQVAKSKGFDYGNTMLYAKFVMSAVL